MESLKHVSASRRARIAFGAVAGVAFLLGAVSPAAAAGLTQAQINAITALLASFNVTATTIANVQTVLSGQATTATSTTTVTGAMIGFLRKGDNGQGVCYLHALLAADPNISVSITAADENGDCPFGPVTERALKQFQKEHGIDQVGFIGPQTLKALEKHLEDDPIGDQEDSSGHHEACAIVPPGHLIAPGWLRKHDNEQPVVPACQTLPPGIEAQLGGEHEQKTLIISAVAASSISTSTAAISWVTSLPASGKVDYGTAGYGNSSALYESLVTSHTVALSGLAPATTYHYRVVSTTASSTAVSNDHVFTTAALPDTTPPVISGISASNIATTTATVSWTTNEPATGAVYYATSSPIVFSTAASLKSSSLVTIHSFGLSGLLAATTYYYAVVSSDVSGNTATSSTSSFMTTN